MGDRQQTGRRRREEEERREEVGEQEAGGKEVGHEEDCRQEVCSEEILDSLCGREEGRSHARSESVIEGAAVLEQSVTRRPTLMIGTAGWSVPRATASAFPDVGSHLRRYSAVFNAVEINSSFYRAHRRETYAKWASTVPSAFKFSVKLPREITHDLRLRASAKPLGKFLDEIDGLGSHLGCVLIQLPPSLVFERAAVKRFLTLFRRHFHGGAVLEPRHISWFLPAVEEVLRTFDVGRVGSDPALCAAAAAPMTGARVAYHRLHGSPRMYYSDYDETFLASLVTELTTPTPRVRERWCIFDNTARGFATANALRVLEISKAL